MSKEVSIDEILKRDAEKNNVDAGYERVDIFEVVNRNLKVEKVDIGEDQYGQYAVIYFDNGKAVKTWSSVLLKQCKVLKEWLEKNQGKKVRVRIIQPKGKRYWTFVGWE